MWFLSPRIWFGVWLDTFFVNKFGEQAKKEQRPEEKK